MYNIIVLSKGFNMSYLSRVEEYFNKYNQYMWAKVEKMLPPPSSSVKNTNVRVHKSNTVTPQVPKGEKLPVPTAEQVLASIQKNNK